MRMAAASSVGKSTTLPAPMSKKLTMSKLTARDRHRAKKVNLSGHFICHYKTELSRAVLHYRISYLISPTRKKSAHP